MSSPRLLVFSGSTRAGSYNRKLAILAAERLEGLGAEVTLVDPRDYRLPLFDADLERDEGAPEQACRLRELFISSRGFLLASPEYNSGVTGVMKNTIDWVSRPGGGVPELAAFRGKVAALSSASPGALGGLRGLMQLRSILGNLGVLVLPGQVAVPRAHEAFGPNGELADTGLAARLEELCRELVRVTRQLQSGEQ